MLTTLKITTVQAELKWGCVVKPHVLPIYYEAQRYRIANFKGYRQQTFNLIDDETYTTNINFS